MNISSRKLIFAALISGGAIAILLFGARFTFPDLSHASPAWLIAVIVAFTAQLWMRGNLLRSFAEPNIRGERWRWMKLVARHQALFSVLPMGIGDAGFPYLANRIAGVPKLAAVRLILQLRMRDAVVILSMALTGLAATNVSTQLAFLIGAIAFPALWFADRIASLALSVASHIIPSERLTSLMREIAEIRPATPVDRAAFTAMSLAIWACSVAATISAFNAIGISMNLGGAFLFIAAVNIAGLAKLTIAGLGISEAGAAAALMAAGSPMHEAASLALIVRPLLLAALLSACLVLDLASCIPAHKRSS